MIGSGRTAASTDPDEIARRAIEKTKGNPAHAEGTCIAIVKILFNKDLTEQEKFDAAADVYKAAKPNVKLQIERTFNIGGEFIKGKSTKGEASKVTPEQKSKAKAFITEGDRVGKHGNELMDWVIGKLREDDPKITLAEGHAIYTAAKES